MLASTINWTPVTIYRIAACAGAAILYIDGLVIDADYQFSSQILQYRWGAGIGLPLIYCALTYMSATLRKYAGEAMLLVAMGVLTYSALIVQATNLSLDAALGSIVIMCGSCIMYHRASLLNLHVPIGLAIFLTVNMNVSDPQVSFEKYTVCLLGFAGFCYALVSLNLNLRRQTEQSEIYANAWFEDAADALIAGDVNQIDQLRINATAHKLFDTHDSHIIADIILNGVTHHEGITREELLVHAAEAEFLEGVYEFGVDQSNAFWGALSLRQINILDQEVTLIRITDISDRIAYERGLERAKSEAETAMQARTRFLANMSHEIRTPMNGVIGMTSLVLDSELSDQQRSFIETIRASGESLLKIINEILDFSKIDADHIQLESKSFDLEACVGESLQVVETNANAKELELILDMSPSLARRYVGDESRIQQVLTNLLSNAVKFTAEGVVLVRVSSAKHNDVADCIKIDVEDSGTGIPANQLDALFDPFTQADLSTTRRFGGTGLGLTISKRLAELMQGDIQVTSEPRVGSCFSFTFIAEHQGQQNSANIPRRGLKVALHDGPASMPVTSKTLTRLGYEVTLFSSLESALQGCSDDTFDALIVGAHRDIRYTEECKAMLEQIRKRQPAMLLSNSRRVANEDFDRVLRKPYRPSEIRAALHDLFGNQKQASTNSTQAALAPLETNGAKFLLAEDNAVNQQVALLMLKKLGIEADLAENGRQAVEMQHNASYDFVFMDIQMPEVDGLEACQLIRQSESTHQPYIIAMTANAMNSDRDNCKAAGMDGFMAKPIRLEDLHGVIQRALKSSTNTLDVAQGSHTARV